MASMKKKWVKQAIGFGFSAAIIIWMVAALDWGEVFKALRSASLLPFIPAFFLICGQFVLRAWRWRFLLPEIENRPSLRTLFDAFMGGNFATYILPGRVGEFVRPFLLWRHGKYPFATAFVSVVIERFFDLATVLLSFAILLNFLPHLDPLIYSGAKIFGLLAIAICGVMLAGIFFPEQLLTVTRRTEVVLPVRAVAALEKFVNDLLAGLTVLQDKKNLAAVVTSSIAIWVSNYIIYTIFLYTVPITPSFLMGASVAVIIALAVALPSSPGFVGVYQAASILGLKVFGVSPEVGAAFGIITHIFQYLIVVGYGFVLLNRYNMNVSDLQAEVRQ